MKCRFEKDTTGFYILPLLGYSNVRGTKSIWFGWAFYLWTWVLSADYKKAERRIDKLEDESNWLEAEVISSLKSIVDRYKDLLRRLGCTGHEGAIAEIDALRKSSGLSV